MCRVSLDEAAPSRTDEFVRGASELIGGPWGAHAVRPRRRFWIPVRVLLLITVVVCAFGWLQKEPCRNPANWGNQHQYTAVCYSDVVALYDAEGLSRGQVPYADHPVEYPVLTGAMMEAAAWLAKAFPVADRTQRFFDITALMLTVCAMVMVWATFRVAGRGRGWDVAMVALAPVLLLHAFTNWDLLAVALTSLAMWAWSRNRLVAAGALLGLGVAAKLYPLLILLLVFPLLSLPARRLRPVLVPLAAAAMSWLVVDVPIWYAYPSSFGRFYSGNFHRLADWDSLFYGVQYLAGRSARPFAGLGFSVAVAGLLVILMGAVLIAVLGAPRRPRVGQVCFLVVLAFLLGNKVWSPQYALWLLPFVVLARPRWGAFLLWQAAEVWLLFTRYYFFIGIDVPGQGAPQWVFLLSVVVRDVILLALAVLVVREMYRPELDVVRRTVGGDPLAGPLETGPDPWPILGSEPGEARAWAASG